MKKRRNELISFKQVIIVNKWFHIQLNIAFCTWTHADVKLPCFNPYKLTSVYISILPIPPYRTTLTPEDENQHIRESFLKNVRLCILLSCISASLLPSLEEGCTPLCIY